MDLLTHSVLGATLAQSAAPRPEIRIATFVGLAAGLLPDVDALIQSTQDPLLTLEYHRHFTHSLLFIPLGAAIAALVLWPFLRRRLEPVRLYLYCLLGYSLGGFLDACTSYGTHLWWPFSHEPVAWSIISIVDPLFTLLIAIPLVAGVVTRRTRVAPIGLALAAAYLLVGAVQHQRAETQARELAASRAHRYERLLVKPTMANLVLWRSLYVIEGRVHVDAVRVGFFGPARIYSGESIPLLDPARDLAWAEPHSRLRRDVDRFTRFSSGLIVTHPTQPHTLGDVRYALLPTSVEPLWGIEFDPMDASSPARFVTLRKLPAEVRQRFIDMLLARPLPAN